MLSGIDCVFVLTQVVFLLLVEVFSVEKSGRETDEDLAPKNLIG